MACRSPRKTKRCKGLRTYQYKNPGRPRGAKKAVWVRVSPATPHSIQPSPGARNSECNRIIRFDSKPQRAFAIADLSPAYAQHARSVRRGMALLDRRQVLVQDEVLSDQPSDVWWFFHTRAQIKAENPSTAILSQGSARLLARILSPAGASFEVRPAEPLPSSPHPEKQAANSTTRKLAIHVPNSKDLRLTVLLVPLKEGEAAPTKTPDPVPLDQW